MIITNLVFANALQWLYDHGRVRDQKHLAEITNITETTISRIINNKVKHPSADTINKVSSLFPGVFDAVLSKNETIKKRATDIQMSVLGHISQAKDTPNVAADERPIPYIPTWADTLLEILSKQIAENEILHSELKQSIMEMNQSMDEIKKMKKQLAELIKKIK